MVFDIIDGCYNYEKAGVSTTDATSATTVTDAIAPNATNFYTFFASLCAAAIGVVMGFCMFHHQKAAIIATQHIFIVIIV